MTSLAAPGTWLGSYSNTMTQWPVGHGGFFTQSIEFNTYRPDEVTKKEPAGQLTIVYDCGSGRGSKPRTSLRTAVDTFLKHQGSRPIDLLVVSHFDSDHINGIDYFARSCRSAGVRVQRVWAPMLSAADRLVLALQVDEDPDGSSAVIGLTLNPGARLPELFPEADVEFFRPSLEEIPRYPAAPPDDEVGGGSSPVQAGRPTTGPGLVMTTTSLPTQEEVWEVRPYVTPQTSQAAQLMDPLLWQFLGKLSSQCTPADLHAIWSNPKLLKTFEQHVKKQVQGSGTPTTRGKGGATPHNHSSLCVYSAPINPHTWYQNRPAAWNGHRLKNFARWRQATAPGWLGTGDAPLATPQQIDGVTARFSPHRMAHVGITSVPHHGSKFDSGAQLWVALPAVRDATIEADSTTGSPGGNVHPHQDVLVQLQGSGVRAWVATQQQHVSWIDKRYR